MKKIISLMLAVIILLGSPIKIFANNSLSPEELITSRNVNVIKSTNDSIQYFYEEDGHRFKNVDTISNDNLSVTTEKYLIDQNKETLVDTIYTQINPNTQKVYLNSKASDVEKTYNIKDIVNTTSDHNWKYRATRYGDTYFDTLTVGAIAAVLAFAVTQVTFIPVTVKAFYVGATYIFDKNLRTAYFKAEEYIDNTYRLRPAYRVFTTIYSDPNRSHVIDKVESIHDATA